MALLGGGPPVGSTGGTFTGAAQALEITGDHVYAYSGAVRALGSSQTLLNFTSPVSGYIVATLTLTAPIDMTNITAGYVRGFQLEFNGQIVGLYKVDTGAADMPTVIQAKILIPPSTAVVLTCEDSGASADYLGTANITGRIYR